MQKGASLMRLIAFATAFLVSASAAQAMTVSTFIMKADALRARGPLALFSSDYGLLKKELTDSVSALHTERLQALKSGGTPAYCPADQSGRMSVGEVMAVMNAVPTANRSRVQVKDALRQHF